MIKIILIWGIAALLAAVSGLASADAQTDELLQMLKAPVAEYQADDRPYVIDPQISKKQYEVSWLIPPIFLLSAAEYAGYKRPLTLEMTIEAGSGRIVQSQVLKSSGSARADRKAQEALANAKLQSIPMVEKSMRYTLVHNFTLPAP